jgi:catechol 2,3-dioxygenase-like lactoylglutathione lyase family enzyme
MQADPKDSAPRFAVVALWANDVPRTAHFYRDVIGLNLIPHHGERPHFDVGGTYLTILRGRPHPAEDAVPARFPVVTFRVPHLERAIARLEAAGVPLPWGIEGEAGSRWVMFHDPAGNLVELVEVN